MIWGIITTFLDSASTMYYKKAAEISMNNYLFQLIGNGGALLIIFYFIFNGSIEIGEIGFILFGFIFVGLLVDFFYSKLEQYIYSTEKVSAIAPFDQLSKIFTIILGFLLFGDVSWITFVIALILVFGLTIANIDFKSKTKLPKKLGILVFYNFLVSLQALLAGYILITINEATYFSIHVLLLTVFLLFILLSKNRKNTKNEIKKINSSFIKNQFLYSFLWHLSFLITFLIIKEEGIVVATILGFLGFLSTMFFSKIFLKEKLEKAHIYLGFFIMIGVSIGFYFKDY